MTTAPTADVQIAITAATAAAAVLPSAEPLTAGTPLAGGDGVAEPFAGAVIADFEGDATGRVAVLVGDVGSPFVTIPLSGSETAAAILVPESTLLDAAFSVPAPQPQTAAPAAAP